MLGAPNKNGGFKPPFLFSDGAKVPKLFCQLLYVIASVQGAGLPAGTGECSGPEVGFAPTSEPAPSSSYWQARVHDAL